jgi:GT2 family glycosyltransferase
MNISVVICTLAERDSLLDCVLSVINQIRKPNKIIVVAGDNSGPRVAEITKDFQELEIINFERRNLAEARNLGVGQSDPEGIIAFLDDDSLAKNYWLLEIESKFTDPDIGVVGGFILNSNESDFQFQNEEANTIGRGRDNPNEVVKSSNYRYWTPAPIGANYAIRYECWREINGFDNFFRFWGEESDFTSRALMAGWQVTFNPNAHVVHLQLEGDHRQSTGIPYSLVQRFASLSRISK